MADENKMILAKEVFEALCNMLESRNTKYDKDEENLMVHFILSGEDIPMRFILVVDAERQLVRLLSPLPFKMNEDKRLEGAIAACAASFGMLDGNFDYDINDGTIVFRMTACYRDSNISEDFFVYMIACSNAMVEKYNDRFLALNKGYMEVSEFIEK